MKKAAQTRSSESGQAVILMLVGLSIFLLGAIGLAIDGSHLYAQRQMAQAAADAGAQAGMMSVFDKTYSSGAHQFATVSGSAIVSGTAYPCSTSDAKTPCYYAQSMNGFNTASDTVTFTPNPSGLSIPNLSATDSINLLQVSVQRSVPTTIMRLLGPSASTITATGTAAIVTSLSPIPILVIHPTLPGSFSKNGSNTIQICGGPTRSIQVNSSDTGSVSISGSSGTVDLSKAGPLDPGTCTTGTGADFGNWGGPTAYPGTISLGTLPGVYRPGASWIQDPLWSMSAPHQPTTVPTGPTPLNPGVGDCPSNLTSKTSLSTCDLYSPGYYASGINLGGSTKSYAIFRPGIYYINHNGFQLTSNSLVRMALATGYNSDNTPSTDPAHTTWTSGMLVYNSPQSPVKSNKDFISIDANSGQINNYSFPDATACGTDSGGNALGGNCLVGANGGALTSSACSGGTAASNYYGVLFFQDHTTATSLSHQLYGGGGLSVKGTVYLTHGRSNIITDGTYQSLDLQGTSGSTTKVQGEIISDTLSLGGNSSIVMNLSGLNCFPVRQLALVQ